MRTSRTFALGLLPAAAALVGCQQASTPPQADSLPLPTVAPAVAPPAKTPPPRTLAEVDWKSLIGRKAHEVMKIVPARFNDFIVIDEVTSCYRCIKGKTPTGEEVWLYLPRAKTADKGWMRGPYQNLPVVGVAASRNGIWQVAGEVNYFQHLPRKDE